MAPRRSSFFFRVLVGVTTLIHATFALAAVEAARRLGAPWPGAFGLSAAALLWLAFFARARSLMPDRPRPRWQLHLVDEPYFVHWCASLGSCLPILAACVLSPLLDVALGRPPAPPWRFALGIYLFAFAVSAWGVLVRRRWVVVNEVEVRVRGLADAFDGYRVVQLSDLHIGGLTPRAWGEAWAARANAIGADLVAITGDLVTSGTHFHVDIAAIVGSLRAPDGVFVSLGNHDYFGEGEPLVSLLEAAGARVLRNAGTHVERGGARLFVAGVDDTWTRRANLDAALSGREDAPAVLLAHDPDLFLDAAARGADLVLSGHTHGGQVALPFFPRLLSLATWTHRRFLGLYRDAHATLYVHAGLGTTGPPVRLGAAPEIAVLTLRVG